MSLEKPATIEYMEDGVMEVKTEPLKRYVLGDKRIRRICRRLRNYQIPEFRMKKIKKSMKTRMSLVIESVRDLRINQS